MFRCIEKIMHKKNPEQPTYNLGRGSICTYTYVGALSCQNMYL